MTIEVSPVAPKEVLFLRDLYRREMNCQIVHDSWHGRGWTNSYLLRVDGRTAGYGLVGGRGAQPRDVVVEFYVLPIHRGAALPLFRQLAATSGARSIEVQTNDILFALMAFDSATTIHVEMVLFNDALTSNLDMPGVSFRRRTESDTVFLHTVEPVGEWVIAIGHEVVATGGILLHYNVPYGDIHMEVAESFRRRGYGSYLVQELKRTCYEMGRVPAARCSVRNVASRATLQRAGLLPCAHILTGVLSG